MASSPKRSWPTPPKPGPAGSGGVPVSIRAAAPADADAIVALVRALAVHVGDGDKVNLTSAALAEAGAGAQPSWRGVVAEAGGEIVGICLYSVLFSTWVGAPGLYVIDLYVLPEFRRGQLGRKLLAAAARRGREYGCRFIRLEVHHRNKSVESFYERLGFDRRAGDTILVLQPNGFDALAGS